MTHTPTHWCNEDTMVEYITTVITPYMNEKWRQLGLDPKHTWLIILDEFKWQTTEKVLKLRGANDLIM